MIERSYEEELKKNGICMSTTSGWSMYPLLRDRRDTVVLAPVNKGLKKYDLPLYRRPDGTYVLHRILGIRPEGYVLCGDHQWRTEFPVPQEWLIGVVTGIYRDEKYVDMQGKGYRLYVRLWCSSLWLRKILLRVLGRYVGLRGKARKIFCKKKG